MCIVLSSSRMLTVTAGLFIVIAPTRDLNCILECGNEQTALPDVFPAHEALHHGLEMHQHQGA